MNVRQRMAAVRFMERQQKHGDYAERLGVSVRMMPCADDGDAVKGAPPTEDVPTVQDDGESRRCFCE